jgi:hypothetical protein
MVEKRVDYRPHGRIAFFGNVVDGEDLEGTWSIVVSDPSAIVMGVSRT